MIDKYKPKNRIEFLEKIGRMYEIKYENVNINIRHDGLEVEYDLYDSDLSGKHQACFIPYPDIDSVAGGGCYLQPERLFLFFMVERTFVSSEQDI